MAVAPRPAALKLLGGRGPGRDSGGRVVADPPAFVRTAPNPPTWLPAEARAEWRRVVPQLDRLHLLKPEDRAALSAYCLAWARLVEANRIVAAEGVLATGPQGRTKHPAVGVAEGAARELRSWCVEFGFTPSAEGRLPTGMSGDTADFD